MAYYRTCPACGANLDPGEKCDCNYEVLMMKPKVPEFDIRDLMTVEANGQFKLDLGGSYECMRNARSAA